ncbi:MAG: CHAT domain-containing tetratricopeptide repeat protein [Acidobacteriota bacterium]
MIHRLALLVASVLWTASALANPPADTVRDLLPAVPVSGHLDDPADPGIWAVEALAGRPLRLRVGLSGHPATLRLVAPDGRDVLHVELPWGRSVPLVVVPQAAGPHQVELRSLERGAPTGRYTLLLDHPEDDVAADRAFGEGLRRGSSGAPDDLRAALTAFETARDLYVDRRDPAGEVLALEALADTHGRLGERDTEIALDRLAVERLADLPPSPGVTKTEARLLDDLALALIRAGRLDDARTAATGSLDRWRTTGDQLGIWRASAGLGLVHLRRGDWQAARTTYERLLDELAGSAEDRMRVRVQTNLGGVHANLGDTDRAIAVLGEALDGARAIGDTPAEARLANNLGALHRRIGEPERAMALYRRALDRFRRDSDSFWQARTLNNLGFTLLGLGDLDAAEQRFSEALPLRREVGDRRGEAVTRRNLGRATELRGDLVAARGHHDAALDIARELGDRRAEADALVLLGRVRRRLGEPEAAEQLRRALAIRRDLKDRVGAARALRELAETHLAHGRPEAARPLLAEALDIHRATREPGAEMETLYVLARVERATGRPDAAITRARAAIALVESLRQRIADPLDRATFLAARRGSYGLLVDLLAQRHRQEPDAGHDLDALEVNEQARARTLLDLLDTPDGVPTVIDGATIPSLLGPGEVLIEIALGDARSHLWRVRSDGVELVTLPGRRQIEALARTVYGELSRLDLNGSSDPSAAAIELADLLLGPVADDPTVERLAVVADGSLHLVPIAALPWPGEPSTLVIDELEVVHHPSISALAAQLRRDPRAPTAEAGLELVVLADPIFDPSDPRLSTPPAFSRADEEDGWLGRLPRTRDEAMAIAALVPPERRVVALGADARLDRIRDEPITSTRILHFATHGLLDPNRPERSGLALSRFTAEGRPIDSLLRVRDLLDLDLSADLVVLSGCRTALGREVRGEGLIGLASGFAYAGVPRVVASLWQVQDAATAELMRRFYRAHLVENLPPSAALRAAQRSIRREPRWRDPFFWAAFVHQGGP